MLCGRSVDLDKIAEPVVGSQEAEQVLSEASQLVLQEDCFKQIRDRDPEMASVIEKVFASLAIRSAVATSENKPISKGLKFDSGKPDMRLIPPMAELEMAKVLTFGAIKYSADNWRLVEPEKYVSALMRHMNAIRRGELIDPESGCYHAAHIMCCGAFLVELLQEDPQGDSVAS